MKKIAIILVAVIALAAGAYAAVYFSSPKKAEQKTAGTGSNLLVSFTDEKLVTSYYENQRKLYQEKMTDYPAMALDRKNQMLYFTNAKDSNMRRLIRLDLKSGKKTTLHRGDEYVDGLSLSPDGSKLYMRYNLPSERNFHLASFDVKKGKFAVLYPKPDNKDESVSYYQYNQQNGRFVLLHYSVEEDYQKTDEANSKGVSPEPTNMRISLGDEKGNHTVKTAAKFINDIAISPEGKMIIFTESDADGEKAAIDALDVKTGKYQAVISDQQAFKLIESAQPQFPKDGEKIYFLAEAKDAKLLEDETGSEAKVRTICSYHLKTKEVRKEWEKPNGIINGFTVLD